MASSYSTKIECGDRVVIPKGTLVFGFPSGFRGAKAKQSYTVTAFKVNEQHVSWRFGHRWCKVEAAHKR